MYEIERSSPLNIVSFKINIKKRIMPYNCPRNDMLTKLSLQSSADAKKRYGIDTKNERYKPGGGNIQVFSQKIDTRSVTPRTDTSKPKAVLSPRASPAKGRCAN